MLTPVRKQFKCSQELIKTIYSMPDWLTRDLTLRSTIGISSFSAMCALIKKSSFGDEGSIRFRHLSGDMIIRWEGDFKKMKMIDARSDRPISIPKKKLLLIERKTPAAWRRELMVSIAMMLQRNLNPPFTDCEVDLQYLNQVIEDPVALEAQALEIWNRFVDDCNVPISFLNPTRQPLDMNELLESKRQDGSQIRQIFMEKFPWVAKTMLGPNSGYSYEFRELDADPSCSKYLVAKHICCRKERSCKKAQKLAKRLPRNSENGEFDQLLDNTNYRRLLLATHNDDAEIVSHIGENIPLVMQQFDFAIEAGRVYLKIVSKNGQSTAFYLTTLLARMMIRNKYVPDLGFNLDEVIKGLALVSADSLSVFIAKAWNKKMRLTGDNTVLDEGVLALVRFIGKINPPRLTASQLIRFARATDSLHRSGLNQISKFPNASWFRLKEKDAEFQEITAKYDWLLIQCLTDAKSLFDEGLAMHNCLRDGYEIRSSILRRLVFFSISYLQSRATLALRPQFSDCETVIVNWEIDELQGEYNTNADSSIRSIAEDILKYFQTHYCIQLSQEEISHKNQITAKFAQIDCLDYWPISSVDIINRLVINTDVVAARNRWKEVYSKLLPRSLSNVDPESIVEEHLASLEKK